MDLIRGVRCPTCGQKHNAPKLHRCHWSNPEGVTHAERVREMKRQIGRQRYRCSTCNYELPERGTTLDQVTSGGVVCRPCRKKEME